jgi:hypothetical protein
VQASARRGGVGDDIEPPRFEKATPQQQSVLLLLLLLLPVDLISFEPAETLTSTFKKRKLRPSQLGE